MCNRFKWYEIVEGTDLEQGDIIDDCPVLVPIETLEDDLEYVHGDVCRYDVIVLSQSCDLKHDKVDFVIVCPHYSFKNEQNKNSRYRNKKIKEDLKQGNIPGYHLLEACEIEGFGCDQRIVDFRNIYSIPLQTIKKIAAAKGKRRRLLAPYREHLSQAFARFFMRVGLPIDIKLD
jgi:hypothetical protein